MSKRIYADSRNQAQPVLPDPVTVETWVQPVATAPSNIISCMELRDYFAAAALTVLLSDQSMVWESKNLAARAYDIADEMLRVRGCSNPVKGAL